MTERPTPRPQPVPVEGPAALHGVEVLTVTVEAGGSRPLAEAAERLWAAQHAVWYGRSRSQIRDHPRVAAYRAFSKEIGVNPDRFAPSVQALIDRGLRNKPAGAWPHVNPVVDAVNAVAVTDLAALGVFDADRVTGQVRLTASQGGEEFLALGADGPVRLDPGRLVLADEARVLSLFAHRDGVHQSVTAGTSRVMLLGCVVPGIDAASVTAALVRAAGLLAAPAS